MTFQPLIPTVLMPVGVSVLTDPADAIMSVDDALQPDLAQGVDFHPEVSRVFHRELTRLKVMFCGLCWGQDMRGLPFRFGYC